MKRSDNHASERPRMPDPHVRQLLDAADRRGTVPLHLLPVEEARLAAQRRRPAVQPDAPPVASVQDMLGPVPLRVYRPLGAIAGEVLPVVVYLHGGGWTLGGLDSHDTLCRQLSNGARAVVVNVGYRLAPEHRFPAAVDDAVAAAKWVHAHAGDLGVDRERIAIAGDSAGGNLAAVAAIQLRDEGGPSLAFQLLLYPVTDLACAMPSHRRNGRGYLITSEALEHYARQYAGDPALAGWRGSPLAAADLSLLPPALVVTAGFDPLHDEGAAYADSLAEAGNAVSHVCFERQIHGFVTMGKVIPESDVAISLCCVQLRRHLAAARSSVEIS